jgi:hypothetical protein
MYTYILSKGIPDSRQSQDFFEKGFFEKDLYFLGKPIVPVELAILQSDRSFPSQKSVFILAINRLIGL